MLDIVCSLSLIEAEVFATLLLILFQAGLEVFSHA